MEAKEGSGSEDVGLADQTLARARAGDERAFRDLVEPLRPELQAHCYRILGSVQDAEDMLQETLLAAWRGLGRFEGRASLRSWLYRIATNRCLNALRAGARHRERLPSASPPPPEPTRRIEPTWIDPYPDSLLEGVADRVLGPEARYDVKESVRLAFVVALQNLPPRQRAVLLLRDVLGFRAAEVAAMLDSSEDAVNSALKRARATLETRLPAHEPGRLMPQSEIERAVADRFADAFQNDDIDGIVALLTDDATLTMPPDPLEYEGPDIIGAFFRDRCSHRVGRGFRLVATYANFQPAFGCYLRDPHAPVARAHGLIVLTVEAERITAITRFLDSSVYPHFGLPRTLRD
jgi:RNA polymerase sigma-70 factor (TIGR02960 family)